MDNVQELATQNNQVSAEQIAAMLDASKKMKQLKPVIKLTSKYIELEKVGESFRGIFAGFSEITVSDKETAELKQLPAARFIVNGEMCINAGAVLVNELRKADVPTGTPLEVTYSKKESNTKIYELTLLA
jgi:hypothetical protein